MRKKKKNRDTQVAWQNKDITSKILAEELAGKSFAVYGIDIPAVKSAEPTNLPAVEANELRMDDLLTLEDSSLAIVDYESRYLPENKVKYLGYAARVAKRIYLKHREYRPLRIIVIYTADVKRGHTDPVLDMGDLRLTITEAFLSDFDPEELFSDIQTGLLAEPIADETLMKLIIYPLTFPDNIDKKKAVAEAIGLAEKIEDREKQLFALTGLYTFTDKIIDDRDAERIRRIINMTKVEMIYTREREEAVERAIKEKDKEIKEKDREIKKDKEFSARALLSEGVSVETVAKCLRMTESRVRKLGAGI